MDNQCSHPSCSNIDGEKWQCTDEACVSNALYWNVLYCSEHLEHNVHSYYDIGG
jgi:hypothetical protein